jgi:copper chaperone CopZ
MHCASCVGVVEGALLRVDGVLSASVSLMTRSAKVHFDDRIADVPKLLACVRASGFGAELNEEAHAKAPEYEKEALRWRAQFLGSLVFTLPVFLLSMVIKAPLAPPPHPPNPSRNPRALATR